MKAIITIIAAFSILYGCNENRKEVSTYLGPPPNVDLHPSQSIRIVRSADGLERLIGIFREEWLGDRYSDPVFVCEASSIDRLLFFLYERVNNTEISIIEGKILLPPGTYSYEFKKKTWVDKKEIFNDVIKATEEAFDLKFLFEQRDGKTIMVVKNKQNNVFQRTAEDRGL